MRIKMEATTAIRNTVFISTERIIQQAGIDWIMTPISAAYVNGVTTAALSEFNRLNVDKKEQVDVVIVGYEERAVLMTALALRNSCVRCLHKISMHSQHHTVIYENIP